MIARENNIEIIDATCPVVLRLQKRIRQGYLADSDKEKQIVIYGKSGHAEVLGLVGQTDGKAIVIAVAVVIVILLTTVLVAVAPFLITFGVILYLISWFRKRKA